MLRGCQHYFLTEPENVSATPLQPLDLLLRMLRPEEAPVNLQAMALRLGLAIRRSQLSSGEAVLNAAEGEILLQDTWRGGTPTEFTHRERFSIAHELGHHICNTWPHVVPYDAQRSERASDYVAGAILFPRNVIQEHVPLAGSPVALAQGLIELARSCDASVEAATRRVCQLMPSVRVECWRMDNAGDPVEVIWSCGKRLRGAQGGRPPRGEIALGADRQLVVLSTSL
ncbi:ImmA/IrrE family metallo-endopeptidase [Ornithinimicrobium sp. CNJ-824]|uniref:ImmA/IrrE family metallo-endopeptidase n=1 Tax=Ornithinimicrobium sp. CNJ-824 TaxID=1904966 RepID=UPI0009FA51B6